MDAPCPSRVSSRRLLLHHSTVTLTDSVPRSDDVKKCVDILVFSTSITVWEDRFYLPHDEERERRGGVCLCSETYLSLG